jgi:serine/threonine protein kinase
VTITAANVLTGTPLYLSPETIRSDEQTDVRSDLYALGAVAYFLLTTVPVFSASTVFEVCAHHLHTDPVPPSQRAVHPIPRDLEDVVLQCLAKQPERRPQTARALHAKLEECRASSPWSREEAVAWWNRHNQRRDSLAAAKTQSISTPDAQTVAVDVSDRVRS